MSDNLEVAKECGAASIGCYVAAFHTPEELDTYTSRILASQSREAELREKLEAAEARIKASQEQSILGTVTYSELRGYSFVPHPDYASIYRGSVYSQPTIPPELAELQRENAELRKLLEEAKSKAVPEEALVEIVTNAHMAGQFNQSQRDPSYYEARVYYSNNQLSIRAMLAAAPQLKESKQ